LPVVRGFVLPMSLGFVVGRSALLCLVVAWGVAVVAGCGKKGDPLAPGSHVPAPVRDFQVVARGPEARLSWRVPVANEAGGGPADVAGYLLYREDVAERLASGCDCRQWELFDTVDLEYPANAFVHGDAVEYVLPLAGVERRNLFAFTVAAKSHRDLASAMAPEQVVNLAPPPPPVRGLHADAGEAAVRLSWRPSAGAAAYRIYRFAPQAALPVVPTTTVPAPPYEDGDVRLGETYAYVVTAVGAGAPPPESSLSEAVTAAPRDRTPPPPPTHLLAISAPGEVRLAWDAPPEPIAFYLLWRSAGLDEGQPIGRVAGERATFTDTAVEPGGHYRYRVIAVDAANNESTPSAWATAEGERRRP